MYATSESILPATPFDNELRDIIDGAPVRGGYTPRPALVERTLGYSCGVTLDSITSVFAGTPILTDARNTDVSGIGLCGTINSDRKTVGNRTIKKRYDIRGDSPGI